MLTIVIIIKLKYYFDDIIILMIQHQSVCSNIPFLFTLSFSDRFFSGWCFKHIIKEKLEKLKHSERIDNHCAFGIFLKY